MLHQHARPAAGRVPAPLWLPAPSPVSPPDTCWLQSSVHARRLSSEAPCSRRAAPPSATSRRDGGAAARAASAASAEQVTGEIAAAVEAAENTLQTIDDVLDGVEADRRRNFSFRLAVALAGCAFESYSSPAIDGCEVPPAAIGGNGDPWTASVDAVSGDAAPRVLTEVAVNGTETTYTCADFLQDTMAGLLRVRLRSAEKLAARDIWGTSDPYCVLSVGASSARSRTIGRTLDPVWDEEMTLFVRDLRTDLLTIKVVDEDRIGADDLIGTCRTSLEARADGEWQDLSLPVVGSNDLSRLHLSVSFTPLTDELAAEVARAEMGPAPEGSPLTRMPDAWRKLAAVAGHTADDLFDPVAFVENLNTDTQVWVFVNKPRKCVVVAFRGTEQVKWRDFLTDVRVNPTAFNTERAHVSHKPRLDVTAVVQHLLSQRQGNSTTASTADGHLSDDSSSSPEEESDTEDGDHAWVHGGFLDAYDSVHAQVLRLVDDLTSCGSRWRILCTGHSLGGALCTLLAYELADRSKKFGQAARVSMYNYGSPRVGNMVFVKQFNRLVPDAWRVYNARDLVCSVPRMMGFAHVGTPVELRADGSYAVQADSREILEEGGVAGDVLDRLLSSTLARIGSDGAAQDTLLDRLMQRELELLHSIWDGSGLADHLEDVYLGVLEAAAQKSASEPRSLKSALDTLGDELEADESVAV